MKFPVGNGFTDGGAAELPERLIVVGYGPVAARFVDELLPAVRAGRFSVLVIGEEPVPAYNRVLIADVGVGRTSAEAIEVSDPGELGEDGVEVLLGTRIVRIDRARRLVVLGNGSSRPYDRLVFATGAEAVVPNLRGLNPEPGAGHLLPPGVTALRSLDDAVKLRTVVADRGHVVVLGGGILGIEAALAAADEGASVTVVHYGPRPLARSVDAGGGTVLAAALRARGIRLVSDARSTGAAFRTQPGGRHRFRALVLDDGTELDGDLLVLSCGVRPRTELASGAGLRTGRGIVVNHRLEADVDRRIFAIGDCAEVRCSDEHCGECSGTTGPSGLIGPGWRQAEWLAGRLSAAAVPAEGAGVGGTSAGQVGSAGLPGTLPAEKPAVILLKARGVDLAAAGAVDAELWDEPGPVAPGGPGPRRVSVWADPEHGKYVKMVTRDGVLEGLVSVGMPRTGAELVLLFERGSELPADRSDLFRLDAAGPAELTAGPPDRKSTLCRCSGASVGQVEDAVGAGCSSVQEVGRSTRAGTGCGGCREKIEEMIAALVAT